MPNTTNTTGSDILRESVANAVGSVVSAMEPQLNEFASKAATQAIDKSRDLVHSAYTGVRRQPWYLVGFAAVLLIGAALLIGFGSSSDMVNEGA